MRYGSKLRKGRLVFRANILRSTISITLPMALIKRLETGWGFDKIVETELACFPNKIFIKCFEQSKYFQVFCVIVQ